MMGLLRDAMEGKLVKARFYTDAWPNFSAVVCEWGSPRVSDVSPRGKLCSRHIYQL